MRDVAKCTNGDCPLAYRCLRFSSKPTRTQVVMLFEPVHIEGTNLVKCEGFVG